MATKKELIDQLTAAGDNLPVGSKDTVADLETRLADAKENGVRHILSQADIDDMPADVKADAEKDGTPLKEGDEVRLPWPTEDAGAGGDETANQAGGKTDEEKAEEAAALAKKEKEDADAELAKKAEADAETVEVELIGNVRHKGVKYRAGDKIEVTGAEARGLRAAKAAK